MKRKHQTIIKHLMQALNNDDMFDLWSILAMLRGNDDGKSELKTLTTARLRALIGLSENMGMFINVHPLDKEQQDHRDRLLDGAQFHFEEHYKSACDSILKVYGYDLAHETWVCRRCAAFMPEFGSCDQNLIEHMPPARRHICGTCRNYEARLRRDRRRCK